MERDKLLSSNMPTMDPNTSSEKRGGYVLAAEGIALRRSSNEQPASHLQKCSEGSEAVTVAQGVRQ